MSYNFWNAYCTQNVLNLLDRGKIMSQIFMFFCPYTIFYKEYFLQNLLLGTLGTQKQYL